MRLAIVLLLLLIPCAQADTGLRKEFAPIAFVVGSCWEGEFDANGVVDRHCFSSVFGGMHIRDVHAVTGGGQIYRGETIFSWDSENSRISFVYWNSIGGVSRGSMSKSGDRISFPDESYIADDGSEVAVETYWVQDGANAYESLTIERYENGTTRERRVRYERIMQKTSH